MAYKFSSSIKNSTKSTFLKSWEARPFEFQWKNLVLGKLLGPGVISMSPDKWNRFFT